MELRHLRYFLGVAEHRHFTRAARKLGIAQPPLSQQIRQLETEIGAPLFTRGPRGVALTPAGEAFLPHAEAAVREAERARAAARRATRGDLGTIRVGFTSAASLNPVVPAIIGDFRRAHPDVELPLIVLPTTPLLRELAHDHVDIAFLRPTAAERHGLSTLPLPDEPLVVALPATHPLARRRRVRLAELRDEPFILYPRMNGSLLYDAIIAACQEAGFSPRVVQEAPQMASIVSLIAAGVGVALVPASVCQLRPDGVTYVELTGRAPCAMLWLVAKRQDAGATGPVASFLRHAERFLRHPPAKTGGM